CRFRQSLHLLAARLVHQSRLRSHLYVDRPAHRLRTQGRRMSDISAKAEVEIVREKVKRPWLSPLNQRRWQNFKANRRGYWSLWIFLILFVLTLFSEFIANDKPIIASYKGEILMPVLIDYPEQKFG